MLIYRIEHPSDGFGPYASQCERLPKLRNLSVYICDAHMDGTHPVAWSIMAYDLMRRRTDHHRCGCDSIEKLKNWFAGWGKRLAYAGYVVKTYKVHGNAVMNMGKQAVFNIKKAKEVGEIAIDFA